MKRAGQDDLRSWVEPRDRLSSQTRDEGDFCLGVAAMAKTERKADHGDEKLYALRHSAAHVMAGAELDLFPAANFGFCGALTAGFNSDFDLPRPLTPEDIGKIESKMREVAKQDLPFEQRDMAVPEAL